MYSRTTLLLVSLFTSLACADTLDPASSRPLAKDDELAPRVLDWKRDLEATYAKRKLIRPRFNGPSREITAKSLKKLFRGYRFITTKWDEVPTEEAGDTETSRAFGLYTILGFKPDSKEVFSFFGYGNYEQFGDLLAKNAVKIDTRDSAVTVWHAFCDLHSKRWHHEREFKRIDPQTWRIGMRASRDSIYYYEVKLNTASEVISGRLRSEKINPRGEQGVAPDR